MWDKNHLDRIHTLIPKLQKNYTTVNTDAIPQDIEMQKLSCKLVTLHGHEMTIPTTSTDADKLTNILKTFSANKW